MFKKTLTTRGGIGLWIMRACHESRDSGCDKNVVARSGGLVATAPGTAIFQADHLAIRSDAGLRVGAPVDAAAGLAQVEDASHVNKHFLATEKAAVVLVRGL